MMSCRLNRNNPAMHRDIPVTGRSVSEFGGANMARLCVRKCHLQSGFF